MKINLDNIDTESFTIESCTIAGETCYLICPKRGQFPKWNRHNLIFRSSIWNSQGEPVSLSYKKFFNWDEQPELAYQPKDFNKNIDLIEKIDGSTLIVSAYKGQLVTRTRGTTTTANFNNANEIQILKDRYPKVFDLQDTNMTYLYEWVSPINKIVINYGERPDIYLTGAIRHHDYSLVQQKELDCIAKNFEVQRPQRFDFSTIQEMLSGIQVLKGQEGLCCYCNTGQDIRKVKSAWYLALHRMKTELGSFERCIDLYFALDKPSYIDFYNHILVNFDYELAENCKGQLSKICDAMKEVNEITSSMREKAESMKAWTRKDAAIKIIQEYGPTSRSGMVFSFLDGNELDTNQIKKLLYQVLKM